MSRGKFIVFEGADASGKDAQIKLLRENMPAEQFVFTREPGSTAIGERIRSILLSDELSNISAETEFLLLLGARAQMLQEVVKPCLQQGKNVISARFSLSTFAYQIYGRQQESWLEPLTYINEQFLGDFEPDLYIFLDVPPEIGLKRTQDRTNMDRFEREKLDFHNRVYNGFYQVLEYHKHRKIDGTQSIENIHRQVLQEVFELTGINVGSDNDHFYENKDQTMAS